MKKGYTMKVKDVRRLRSEDRRQKKKEDVMSEEKRDNV